MSIIDKKTKAIVQNQKKGGGGEPEQYLKTIVKDEANKEITITDKEGNETTFNYGGSGKKNSYASLTSIREYAHHAVYTDIDYAKAYEFFAQMKPTPNAKFNYKPQGKSPFGACSAFYFNGIMGRCYDWGFNEQESIEVTTPAINDRKAVIGTGYNAELIKEVVESGEYHEHFDYVPFELVDGMNESGFSIAMLVVPNDYGVTTGTTPSGEVEAEVSTIMLPRYLLDRCGSVEDAMDILENEISVFNVMPLIQMGYELHFFVADANGTHGIIEFIDNAVEFNRTSIATNFYIHGVQFNEDGTVYTPATQDADHDAKQTNLITDYGSGLERYNLILQSLRNARGMDDIRTLLYNLKYTNSYSRTTNPFWYTEFVGGDYKVDTPVATYDAEGGIVERAIAEFGRRDRATGTTWQTVHGGIFNIEDRTLYLVFQEDMSTIYEFNLEYYTKDQIDAMLHELVRGNLKYNTQQTLSDTEFNQIMENLKLGAKIETSSTMETIYEAQDIDITFDNPTFTIPNAEVRAFRGDRAYEVPLTFGAMGTINVEAKYKGETLLILDAELPGVKFLSLEIQGTDIVLTVQSELSEVPHLTGIQINEMTEQRTVTPISEEFIPKDSTKQDKEDENLETEDKTVVGAVNELLEKFDTKQDKIVVKSIELYASGWNNKQQVVADGDILKADYVEVSGNVHNLVNPMDYGVRAVSNDDGSITFACDTTPTVDIVMDLVIIKQDAPASFTITYITEHGETPQEITVDAGTQLDASMLPTLEEDGYWFGEWYDKYYSKKYAVGEAVVENLELHARWEDITTPLSSEPLCFTAAIENAAFVFERWQVVELVFSYDKENWEDYTGQAIILENIGDKAYFRAKTTNETCQGLEFSPKPRQEAALYLSGNIQTLLASDGQRYDVPEGCFGFLCFDKNILSAPELPATILGKNCYYSLFAGSKITEIELPATVPEEVSYIYMLSGCTELVSIKTNQKSWGAVARNTDWVKNVSANGDFYCPAELPPITGDSNIPANWTIHTLEEV